MRLKRLLPLLFLVQLTSNGGTWAADSTMTVRRLQWIEHRVDDPLFESSSPEGSTDGDDRVSRTLVENRIENGKKWRLFYKYKSHAGTDALELIAVESLRTDDDSVQAFRHRIQLNGEEAWTSWLSASLKQNAVFPWPVEKNGSSSADTDPSSLSAFSRPSIQAEQELTETDARFNLFTPVTTQGLNWAPGNYEWGYDASKITIWSGYLWDFKKAWMFRGFRKPKVAETVLTPSQQQGQHDPRKVTDYYLAQPPGIDRPYHADNSRNLSPMDKWGFWASRKFGQTWWKAASWEGINHHTNLTWGGYCNASTTLPFLWKKPQHGVVDQNLTFDPRDLVAIIQAASYHVEYLFWGHRYNGKSGEPIAEPTPDFVIGLLAEYLGNQHIPMVFDHEAGPAVGNILALKSRLKVEATEDPLVRNGFLEIDNMGNMEDDLAQGAEDQEALVPDWSWGTDTKKYSFKIYLNPDGSLKTTAWEKPDFHPDFLWFPTGIKDSYPAPHKTNPYLELNYVRELVKKSLN